MLIVAALTDLGAVWLTLSDGVIDGPEPEDVKAGWGAFAIFLLLALAVALLGWSFVRQIRKAQGAADAGLYDPSPPRQERPRVPLAPDPDARPGPEPGPGPDAGPDGSADPRSDAGPDPQDPRGTGG